MIPWIARYLESLRARRALLPTLYLALLLGITAFFIGRWPVVAYDTDLWYHLAGGRYIVQNGALPTDSYFSFLEPVRPFTDYYWMFQVLVYAVESVGGYLGLVVLRALLVLGSVFLAGRLLLAGRTGSLANWIAAGVLTLAVLTLTQRQLVRPYLASYLILLAVLNLRELSPRRIVLPTVLAVLLTNLHGVEYPVLIAICGAYGAEWVFAPWTGAGPRPDRRVLAAAVVPILGVLATPHFVWLLPVAFRSIEYAHLYVGELHKLSPADLLDLRVENFAALDNTSLVLILACTALAIAALAVSRRLRLAHILLAAAGLFLLARSARFIQECVILQLPLLRAAIGLLDGRDLPAFFGWRPPRPLAVVVACLPAVVPLQSFRTAFAHRPLFPFTSRGLPEGVVRFLESEGGGGKLFHGPDPGGFLEWRLYPQYRLTLDMQNPFLFTADDMFFVRAAQDDPVVQRKMLDKYRPEYLLAPLGNRRSVRHADALEDYAPVFFDDDGMLYASRAAKPDVVARYTLEVLHPFSLVAANPAGVDEATRSRAKQELERLFRFFPEGRSANLLAAKIAMLEGEPQRARERAEACLAGFPEFAGCHEMLGEALFAMEQPQEAARSFRLALRQQTVEGPDIPRIHRRLADCYRKVGDPTAAFHHLETAAGGAMAEGATAEDLYELGLAAERAGERQPALRYMRYAVLKAPVDPPELRTRIKSKLEELRRGGGD